MIDGLGSHTTLNFLETALKLKILVAVYPPHATHRLQPLDVGCFAPLAMYYGKELENHLRLSEGKIKMSKRDFFHCFQPAWFKAFNEHNVMSAWKKTGLIPFNPALVLDQIRPTDVVTSAPRRRAATPTSSPPLAPKTPRSKRKLKDFINETVDKRTKKYLQNANREMSSMQAELTLTKETVNGLKYAFDREKKHTKRGKKLIEQHRADKGSGHLIFGPEGVAELLRLQTTREEAKELASKAKEAAVVAKALEKAEKEAEVQQRRIERMEAAKVKAAEKASEKGQKAAEREAKKAQKQLETEQKAFNRGQRGLSKHQPVLVDVVDEEEEEEIVVKVEELLKSRSGRSIRRPAHLKD